jgi:multiple sugar transport system permease protein/fructooligosaccharide transport system permease protein
MGRWANGAKWAVGLAVAVVFLAPVLWVLLSSFKQSNTIFSAGWSGFSASAWTLENYANALRRADLLRTVGNSLAQIATIASVGLIVNSMAAFAFARLPFRGREPLFFLIVVLIILPTEVLAVPLFLTARDLGLTGGTEAIFLGLTLPFVAKAFNIYFLRQHFLSWPTEIEEAAVLDGAGPFRIFWSVALPCIRPALATVALLDVVVHYGDFLWPLLIVTRESNRTVQIGLANLFTEPPIDWGAIMACAVMATLPVVLGFRFLQRYIVVTDTSFGSK